MKWRDTFKGPVSEDGEYMIPYQTKTPSGSYALMKYSQEHRCYCQVLGVGTIDEMKERADDVVRD